VVVTADEMSVERIRKLVAYFDSPLEQSGNVRVVYLEYADATETAEVLTRVMQNIARLEAGGNQRNGGESTIEADAGTNSLIITADTDEMAAL
jgi:general secretion pathway protein D